MNTHFLCNLPLDHQDRDLQPYPFHPEVLLPLVLLSPLGCHVLPIKQLYVKYPAVRRSIRQKQINYTCGTIALESFCSEMAYAELNKQQTHVYSFSHNKRLF